MSVKRLRGGEGCSDSVCVEWAKETCTQMQLHRRRVLAYRRYKVQPKNEGDDYENDATGLIERAVRIATGVSSSDMSFDVIVRGKLSTVTFVV